MLDHAIARAKEVLGARRGQRYRRRSPDPVRRLAFAGHGRAWATILTVRWSTAGADSHEVKNLFIVDGSVFVTSGGVNPTSTIQAVAL